MLYLLDANVLITANNNYYPLERVPEFWTWIVHQGDIGNIKIPAEISEEICNGTDELAKWLAKRETQKSLLLVEEVDVDILQSVIETGYANDLNDIEVEELGRDPFLIAYALVDPQHRIIVTAEVSKPKRTRQNRHVPDVCDSLAVSWRDSFGLVRDLDFSTSWNKRQ